MGLWDWLLDRFWGGCCQMPIKAKWKQHFQFFIQARQCFSTVPSFQIFGLQLPDFSRLAGEFRKLESRKLPWLRNTEIRHQPAFFGRRRCALKPSFSALLIVFAGSWVLPEQGCWRRRKGLLCFSAKPLSRLNPTFWSWASRADANAKKSLRR